MSDMETDTETERGTDIEDETDTEIETGTERDSDMETDTESGDSRSFLQYYDDLPPKLKYMIIAKLARDRRSFISWSLARRQNMEEFRKASFWIGLLESEGRTVSPKHVMKTAKLMNAFYRRAYNGVKIDEEVACVQMNGGISAIFRGLLPGYYMIECTYRVVDAPSFTGGVIPCVDPVLKVSQDEPDLKVLIWCNKAHTPHLYDVFYDSARNKALNRPGSFSYMELSVEKFNNAFDFPCVLSPKVTRTLIPPASGSNKIIFSGSTSKDTKVSAVVGPIVRGDLLRVKPEWFCVRARARMFGTTDRYIHEKTRSQQGMAAGRDFDGKPFNLGSVMWDGKQVLGYSQHGDGLHFSTPEAAETWRPLLSGPYAMLGNLLEYEWQKVPVQSLSCHAKKRGVDLKYSEDSKNPSLYAVRIQFHGWVGSTGQMREPGVSESMCILPGVYQEHCAAPEFVYNGRRSCSLSQEAMVEVLCYKTFLPENRPKYSRKNSEALDDKADA